VMYHQGHGVAQDFNEAIKWYRLAAAQGESHAQVALGGMYAKGEGVTQDNLRGNMWFSIAAAHGDAGAGKDRDTLATTMTAAQIAEAQAMADKCQASHYQQCD